MSTNELFQELAAYDEFRRVCPPGAEIRAMTEMLAGGVFPVGMGETRREVVINPEWLALAGRPHFVLMTDDPNAYKSIQTGPTPFPL